MCMRTSAFLSVEVWKSSQFQQEGASCRRRPHSEILAWGTSAEEVRPSRPACWYVRVSTEEQAKDGESLHRQEALIRAEAERQGWELVAVLRDEGSAAASPPASGPDSRR